MWDFLFMLFAVSVIVSIPLIGDDPHDVWDEHIPQHEDDDDDDLRGYRL